MPTVRYPCYILSYKRAGNVPTLSTLPPMLRPILAVCDDQADEYIERHPGVEVLPVPIKGIGKTRDWLCAYAVEHGQKVFGMLDDDITSWLYKKAPTEFGGVVQATAAQISARWNYQISFALRLESEGRGFACSFPWRTALAYPHKPMQKWGVRLGLVNACKMMNLEAAKKASFKIETCDDVHCTLGWVLSGVVAGQDPHLGHTEQMQYASTTEHGGTGEYRDGNPDHYYIGHMQVWEAFPQVCAKPVQVPGKIRPKTRIGYKKAAQLGGII